VRGPACSEVTGAFVLKFLSRNSYLLTPVEKDASNRLRLERYEEPQVADIF